MKYKADIFIPLITLISFFSGIGQELIHESSKLANLLRKDRYSHNITFNSSGDQMYLSFIQSDEILIYPMNKGYEKTGIHKILLPGLELLEFQESSIIDNELTFFFAHGTNKTFFGVKKNLETKKQIIKKFAFKFLKEEYLGTFKNKNQYFIVSLVKNTRIIKFRIINSNFDEVIKEIDLENGSYYSQGDLKDFPPIPTNSNQDPLIQLKKEILANGLANGFSVIYRDKPYNAYDYTRRNKMYVYENNLVLTLDSPEFSTTLIQINLDDYSSVVQSISNTHFSNDFAQINQSNSFLYGNKLFLMKGTKNRIAFNIYDLETHESLKSIVFDRDYPFSDQRNLFLTSALLTEHNLNNPEREVKEKVSKLFNKIMKSSSNNEAGIRVLSAKENYFITFGGNLTKTTGGGIGPIVIMGITSKENSLSFFLKKENNELTYSDFEVPSDKIEKLLQKEFGTKVKNKVSWKTNFIFDGNHFLGYKDKQKKTYKIIKYN